jgi:hypothetical protein
MAKPGPAPGDRSQRASDPPPLADLGISHTQSSRWQKLAAIPDAAFETALTEAGRPTTTGLIADETPMMPVDNRALWLWGRLKDFERLRRAGRRSQRPAGNHVRPRARHVIAQSERLAPSPHPHRRYATWAPCAAWPRPNIRVVRRKVVAKAGSGRSQAGLSQSDCRLIAMPAIQARTTGCRSRDRESSTGTARHRRWFDLTDKYP